MKKQSFIFGSIILLASAVIVKIIGALFKIPLTNMLGGTAMGYFSCAYGIFLPVYAITGTGLCAAVAKMTAESAALGNMRNVRKIYSASMAVFGIIGFFASVTLFFTSKHFAVTVLNSPQSHTAVALIAPSVLFGCITSVVRGHFEGLRNMYPTALSQIIEAISKLIFGLLGADYVMKNFEKVKFLFPENTNCEAAAAAAAIFGITLSTLFGALFLLIFKKNNYDIETLTKTQKDYFFSDVVLGIFSVMLPIALGALVTNLTSLIDLFTINHLLEKCILNNSDYFFESYRFMQNHPQSEIPSFIFGSFSGLAMTIFTLVPSVTNMLGKSVLSASSDAYAKGDKSTLQDTAEKSCALTAFLAMPIALGITFMSEQILNLLYSSRIDEIEAAKNSLAILGLGVIFLCLSFPMFSLLQGASRADLPVKIMLCGVFIKFFGNLLFLSLPQTSIFGAALSTLLCYVLIFMLSLLALKRKCDIKLSFKTAILPFLFSSLLCALSAKASYFWLKSFNSPNRACVIGIGIGAIVYFVSLYLTQKCCTKSVSTFS